MEVNLKALKKFFEPSLFQHRGHCPICEKAVKFRAKGSWFRDQLLCLSCGSIPRERALMKVIADHYPNWRKLRIHESSPVERGASSKLRRQCSQYTASQYYPDVTPGQEHQDSGYRCENLEALTFMDESFDLFISQDVMEHVLDPAVAFQEISRVLKPGGAHIFTAPLVNKVGKTQIRASRNTMGEITLHGEPIYHGNPVDANGSLVTIDWGYDIARFILEKAGLSTLIVAIDDIDLGIRAEFIDVLVSIKDH